MEYSSSDLYEAAALVTSGLDLLRIQPSFRGRMEFVFQQNDLCEKVTQEFTNGRLTLNVKSFIGAWRQLRRRIDQEDMRHARSEKQNFSSR